MAEKSQAVLPKPSHMTADEEDACVLDDGQPPLDFEELAHAPPTSHGTYLDGISEGLEPLEEYQEGGYHPVHLGDRLGSAGRYRVIHKLGHGGFGTVWLCRDLHDPGYVAVKIVAGDVARETLPDLKLTHLDPSAPGAEFVAMLLDTFTMTGLNGLHQCIVLPVLGPCVLPRHWLSLDEPVPVLRRMAYQSALALNFLYKQGLCHGDFRPTNILVKLADINRISEDALLSLLGQPEGIHLVPPADTSRLSPEYLTDQICVIDFGESFQVSSPPADLGIPENYLPPEVLLDRENAISQACDIWALGCTLFEIREQMALFYMISGRDELLAEIVRFFGKPPQEWWDRWDARDEFFDGDGIWLPREEGKWSLEVALSKPTRIFLPGAVGGEAHRSLVTPEAERKKMADLLYKIFRYEPGERPSAEDILTHEWFRI